ncbi:MAG: pyridoxine 5'-phosphate synthase, partial [Sutterella wadsworthensis]
MLRTKLSVNLNKVALLRNSREGNWPDPVFFGRIALEAGAAGLTVHPRPDERHVRATDVPAIAALVSEYPDREYNNEGNPFHNLMGHLEAVRP